MATDKTWTFTVAPPTDAVVPSDTVQINSGPATFGSCGTTVRVPEHKTPSLTFRAILGGESAQVHLELPMAR